MVFGVFWPLHAVWITEGLLYHWGTRVFHVVNFVDKNLRHAPSLKSIATRIATALRSFPVWLY